MIKRHETARLVRENFIELEVVSNTHCFCMFKSDKLQYPVEFIWEGYRESQFIDIMICKHMKKFFERKWLIIVDFGISTKGMDKEDKELVKNMELRDIYQYLGIDKFFEWSIDNELILHDIQYFHNLLLDASPDELSIALHALQKPDKIFLFNTAVMLYKENVFNDLRKIDIIEQYFDRLDFFRLDL